MNRINNWIQILGVLFIFIVSITGCTSVPIDTVNKRLAVFEIGYNETLTTVKMWLDENRFNNAQKAQIKIDVGKMKNARVALYVARDLKDFSKMNSELEIANQSLLLIRNYLKTMEGGRNGSTKYNPSARHVNSRFKYYDKIASFIDKSRNRKPRRYGNGVVVFT